MSKLDELEVEIEFHEGEYTSHQDGKLTPESKQQIKELYEQVKQQAYDRFMPMHDTIDDYLDYLDEEIEKL